MASEFFAMVIITALVIYSLERIKNEGIIVNTFVKNIAVKIASIIGW